MFELINKNGVSYFRSTVLKSKHGFSTRVGGFSALEHTRGLNIAFGRGDDEETVLKNIMALEKAIELPSGRIISVPQIHGAEVRAVTMRDAAPVFTRRRNLSVMAMLPPIADFR